MSTYAKITTPLLELSEAEDYEDAKLEWRITGNVWRDTEQAVRDHPSNHSNHCLCGHNIVYHFEIENTLNKTKEIVGSTCIGNWMVLRHMSEKLNIPKDTITEAMIEEWKKVAVTGLVKDAWWEENGVQFEMDFDFIRDFDLRLNVRRGKRFFNRDSGRYEHKKLLRKRAEGDYGHPEYKMASIVWRWNHPQNTRAQIHNTRGFPDDKLLRDMTLFQLEMEEYISRIDADKLKGNIKRIVREVENLIMEDRLKQVCSYYDIPMFNPVNDSTSDWEHDFLNSIKKQLLDNRELSGRQIESLLKIINRNNKTPTDAQTSYLTALGYTGTMPTTHLEISKLINEWKEKRHNQINGGI